MSSYDRIPANQPIRALKEAREISREIKAPQPLGSSSVLKWRVFSQAAYDIQVPATGSTTQTVLVTFTPNDQTFGGPLVHQLKVKAWLVPSPGAQQGVFIDRQRSTGPVQQWLVYWDAFGSDPLRMKLYFFAGGSGTFSCALV